MIFGKKKTDKAEQIIGSILNAEDADVLVTRGKGCEILFMNEAAQKRLAMRELQGKSCRDYTRMFPALCDSCPGRQEIKQEEALRFVTQDENQHFFSAVCKSIEWVDGKEALLLILRDVDEARRVEKRLYNLAYIDHLTGIPNRQRLKEDFEELAEAIAAKSIVGALAIFDMDNFKAINDNYGHNTGDIMLRRLAEHLQEEPDFAGHLYRLGGDEFVLLLADSASRFASDEELREHYAELLKKALCDYTIPYIELSCTLSMGIAFFPQHGTTTSDLLRKADIALYKSKAEGRNRLTLFDEKFNTVKKLKDLYINIQPVLSNAGRTYGYELVDRGNEGKEDEQVNLSDFNRTLDALGLDDIENDACFFINFSKQLLSASVRNHLPKDKFIIQLPAPEGAARPEELLLLRDLKGYGYSLALVGVRSAEIAPELLAMADFCKFAPGAVSEIAQKQLIAAHPTKVFIAADINVQADFQRAKTLGFKLFQGFFFSQPVVMKKTKEIDPMRLNYFRLLKLTSTDGFVDFREISAVIGSDVALSYKLLRLLNSAAVGLRYRISSISMAVAYLGEENLKKWIALLALRGVAADKPPELLRMSLIRARFGELLAQDFRPKRDAKQVFLVGMLSLLHVALDKSKEDVLSEMPVADEIRESLLGDGGLYSDLLLFYSNYEYGNWDEVSRYAGERGLDPQSINAAYIAAVKWYNDLVQPIK